MARFHHLWVVSAELEIRNPTTSSNDARCQRVYEALADYGSDETEPYPTQASRSDDGWLEASFPVWAPTRFAAVAAGATLLAEVCTACGVDVGVVRLAAGESADELHDYRARVHAMEVEPG
jgi:hypothetical protein